MNAFNGLARRPRPMPWQILDVLVACVLVGISVATEMWRHADVVAVVAVAAATATVAWARRAPRTACLVALAAAAVVFASSASPPGAGRFLLPLLAGAVDYYMLGRRSAERGWEPTTILLLGASIPAALVGVGFSDVLTVIVRLAWWFAPFAAGRAIASRSATAANNRRLEREQREHARRVAGEERTRVARELHDIVAHSVSVMVIHAVAAREVADQNRDVAREALRTVQACGREALNEMRRMIGVLRRGDHEPVGDTEPGLSTLEALVDRARASGLDVEVRVEGVRRPLASGVDLTAFRVVQEALTNTIKHAGPTRANVVITYSDRALELEITDRGRVPAGAYWSSAPLGGNGLAGMRERVMLYGGEMATGTCPGGGFRVTARLPVDGTVDERAANRMGASPIEPRERAHWFDPGLAAILLVVAEGELMLVTHGRPSIRDALLLVGLTVPVAWRRRAPLGVAGAVMSVLVACSVGANPLIGVVQSPLIAALVVTYAVAAYSPGVRAWVGLAVCVAGPELAVLIAAGGIGAAEISFAVSVASWVTGRAVRAYRERADEMRRTSERIASEQNHRERLAVVEERTRIARELQAAVARSVSTMVVQSEAAERLLDTGEPQARDAMVAIENTGRRALDEMRRILGVLRDPDHEADLAPQPGIGQLYALIEDARASGRPVELHVEGDPRPVPASVDLSIYRILQEALAGTATTHDTGAPIAVTVSFGDSDVALDVTARRPAPISWPTVTMRERAALCAGEVTVEELGSDSERLRVLMPATLEGALAVAEAS